MVKAIIDKAAGKMKKTEEVLRSELMSIRAGRANPQLLDRIMVDYYGTPTPLTSMANVAAPEPRLLTISLWDTSALSLVEKAILKSDLGLTPSNDGKIIRLALPELTEERRRDLTKLVRKNTEDAKVAIRSIRRDAIEQIKKLKKEAVPEDDIKRGEEEMQKKTDAAIKELDRICEEKEKEILEVR